ncbi:hypothetical protein PT182_08200 [Erysipelothrix rhusiopathiae]|nr:hypothetical protein [Erysipelothrix rhusiopathiae]MDE8200980.1 hypothetical protein [Erysipelothrix rhusiopathiae]MDE8226569.1 hypothetical protein [Erysipelothrix rhusiopathiae]MDE8229953.1 hypothetical protein [Erysipelothrix rhusiopathiae]
MSDLQLHMAKVNELMAFQNSKNFQHLSECSKYKLKRRLNFHLHQILDYYTNFAFELFHAIKRAVEEVMVCFEPFICAIIKLVVGEADD